MEPDSENIWHVVPLHDEKEHIEKTEFRSVINQNGFMDTYIVCNCPCEPTIQLLSNGGIIIIHDAFDGRQGVEFANEILNG